MIQKFHFFEKWNFSATFQRTFCVGNTKEKPAMLGIIAECSIFF